MNSSVQELTECIIGYRDFYASLDAGDEDNALAMRKFSDEEFAKFCEGFKVIDNKCLLDDNCWKSELDYLLWERDNE